MKKAICILLSAIFLLGLLPAGAIAQGGGIGEPAVWESSRIAELSPEELAEGVIYFGSAGKSVGEKGEYSLTIYRDGSSSAAATVNFLTLDVSAAIGEDYDIVSGDTEYYDLGGTIMERNVGVDVEQRLGDYQASLQGLVDELADEAPDGGESAPTGAYSGDVSAEELEKAAAETGKSKLALIKEAATGEPSRELYSSNVGTSLISDVTDEVMGEDKGVQQQLLEDTHGNMGDYAQGSSLTTLTFLPGETEKTVTIHVLEDDIPEDNEIAIFMLSGAEGALVGDLNSFTLTIQDDEQREKAYVGFASDAQSLAGSEGEISLHRTGADYYMATAQLNLYTADGGEMGSQTVTFKPYETEVSAEVSIDGVGAAVATLTDFKGCEAGEIVSAAVSFSDEAQPTVSMLSNSSAMVGSSRSGTLSFYLKGISGSNGYGLRVDYVPGQYDENKNLIGYIYDEGKTPEVQVGVYYFPSSFETNLHGGAQSNPDWWHSRYCNSDGMTVSGTIPDVGDDYPDGYINLEWYDSGIWDNGYAYCELKYVPMNRYMYMSPDWAQDRTFGGGQKSKIEVIAARGSTTVTNPKVKSDNFSRTSESKCTTLVNSLPSDITGTVRVFALDDDGGKTPKLRVELFGVAGMYRNFDIALEQPGEMSFQDAEKTKNEKPCNVSLGEGHETRYINQSLQIISTPNDTKTGLIKGDLIGYQVEVNHMDAENKTTFYYMAEGFQPTQAVSSTISSVGSDPIYHAPAGANISNIKFDDTFIGYIDESIKAVSGGDTDWDVKLKFTPLFKYRDVKVTVYANDDGGFTESNLSVGDHNDFHVGDYIKLSGTPKDETLEYVGYKVEGRATVNPNEEPIIDCTQWVDPGTSGFMTMGDSGCLYYRLTPQFIRDKGNYIQLKLEGGAESVVKPMNVLTADQLIKIINYYPNYGFDTHQIILVCEPNAEGATEAEKLLNMITAKPGKVYQIQALCTDSGKTPTFANAYQTLPAGEKVTSCCFDMAASDALSENIVTVGVADSGTQNYYQLEGYLYLGKYSVRTTEQLETLPNFPAQGMNVYAGGEINQMWMTLAGAASAVKSTYVERRIGSVDEYGHYSVEGVCGAAGTYVSMYFSNSDVEKVMYVKLGENADYGKEMTFYRNATDDSRRTNYDEEFKVTGYLQDCGTDYTPVFSQGSPYPSSVDYEFDSDANTQMFGTMSNSVAIMDDYFTVTANINPNGRTVKRVRFTVDKREGDDLRYDIDAKVGQTSFDCNFGGKTMDKVFEDGDRLFITLYDAETRQVSYASTNEDGSPVLDSGGNQVYYTVDEEIEYSTVFTGLDFFIPTLDVTPQFYNVGSDLQMEIPVIGGAIGSMKSGVLSFTKEEWAPGVSNSPYTLLFDANAGASNLGIRPAQDILHDVRGMKNNAKEEAEWWAEGDGPFGGLFGDEANKEKQRHADAAYKRSLTNTFDKSKINLNVIVIFGLHFAFNEQTGEYVYFGGQVAVGGMFSISHTFYTVVSGIPLYMQLSASVEAQITANYYYDENLTADDFAFYENIEEAMPDGTDVGLFLQLTGKMSVGVGICGVLSARGIIEIDLRIFISFTDFVDGSGISATLKGGIGVDLFVFTFEYMADIGTLGAGIYDSHWGGDSGFQSGKLRTYHMGGEGRADAPAAAPNAAVRSSQILAPNAPERTRPQLLELENGNKFLVYIGARSVPEGSPDENKPCLYYRVYNGGTWSPALPVDPDSNTADTTPALAKRDGKVYIAWADANRAFTGADDEKTMLSLFDISLCAYDTASGNMGEKVTLSDQETYGENFLDYSPVICTQDTADDISVFYTKRDVLKATDPGQLVIPTALYEAIAVASLNVSTGEIKRDFLNISGDPLVLDLDAVVIADLYDGHDMAVCTYTLDKDKDFSTSDDQDVYMQFYDLTAGKSYKTINLCSNYTPDYAPQLARITAPERGAVTDKVMLTWLSKSSGTEANSNTQTWFNVLSVTDMLGEIQHGGGDNTWSYPLSRFFERNVGNWYKKTARQVGISEEDYKDSVFADMCRDVFPAQHNQLALNANKDSAMTEYKLFQGDDHSIYLVWTDVGSTVHDDYSIELFGAMNDLTIAGENERGGWSKAVKLTDFGAKQGDTYPNTVLDEISAGVEKGGSFDLVSNMFSQNISEDAAHKRWQMDYSKNNLMYFSLNTAAEPEIADIMFEPEYPRAGKPVTVSFTVKNGGLLPIAKGCRVEVAGIGEVDIEDRILGGEEVRLSVIGTMPAVTSIGLSLKDGGGAEIASLTEPVPTSHHLSFSDGKLTKKSDGTYGYALKVTNDGNEAIGDFDLTVQRFAPEGGYDPESIPSTTQVSGIAAGGHQTVTMPLSADTLNAEDFGSFGIARLGLTAKQGDTEVGCGSDMVFLKGETDNISLNGHYRLLFLDMGDEMRLRPLLHNSTEGSFTYQTDNPDIAYVDSFGYLHGLKGGSTTLTVTETGSGKSSTFRVTVKTPNYVEDEPTTDAPPAAGVTPGEGGTVTLSPLNPAAGQTVTITVKPDEGKQLDSLSVRIKNGGSVALTKVNDTTYTFTMPNAPIEVTATFKDAADTPLPFTDVALTDWFYAAVKYCYENGLMEGTGGGKFSPGVDMTREMVWTVLARMSGETITGADWNVKAREWAMTKGISDGTNPTAVIDRQQLVTMLYRYAKSKGLVTDEGGAMGMAGFEDVDEIADWAYDAFSWAVHTGIIEGSEGRLMPKKSATRAEVATVIMRFDKLLKE